MIQNTTGRKAKQQQTQPSDKTQQLVWVFIQNTKLNHQQV